MRITPLFRRHISKADVAISRVPPAQESGSDVHQHKQALKDLEVKLEVSVKILSAVRANKGPNVPARTTSITALPRVPPRNPVQMD